MGDARTPEEARLYVALFREHTLPKGADHVDTSSGRRIWLDAMTDEEALFVAREFERMELEAAKRGRPGRPH